MHSFTLRAHEHCDTGENPLWDDRRRCVFWTDITNGKVFRYDIDAGTPRAIYEGEPVGGFTLQENGDLLLFRVNDIALLGEGGTPAVLLRCDDDGMERFNDVIADPEGRVFAGTIGRTSESGGLYRLDPDGTLTKLFDGTGCANGMGFGPDGRTFYWTCSTTRRIFRFHYDRKTGALSNRALFYQATEAEGIPDGMCVDNTGHVWSARYDGSAIVRHNPQGHVVETIKTPVAKVTSCCLGGRDLDMLYVTSAGGRTGSGTADGGLFSIEVSALGLPEYRSRISKPTP